MADSDVYVLNDYNGSSLTRRTPRLKSGRSGKARYTVTISSEPLLIQTDPKALGAGPAAAIRDLLKQRTEDITATASEATMKARLSAQKAVMNGERWAMRRYSGGRIGTRAPARSDRLFNDSGRLIESIAVGATSKGYVINVAGNRFDPSTLNGGEAALLRIVDRLRELVPEFGDPKLLLDSLPVQRALRDGAREMVQKANARTVQTERQLMHTAAGIAVRLLRLVA